ncbi:hypothetical protein MMC07_000870 [Pseudocyphellaria aurata]|nr:hypothetical protein [Pseudocyphellaria aurata]
MFKKKPTIKPLSPIRSSDRRKIADQIIANFEIEKPEAQAVEADEHDSASTNSTLGELRNSLLPEGSLSARFTTTVGPNLTQVSGFIYVGAHPGEEQRVLWIKIDERLVPTVYTLWRHPQLVPLLHTQDFVLQKLRTGADLMTPGLARGPPFPQKARKNAIVAIASIENPSVPRVVGECTIDIASLERVQGTKGHAVRGYHWDGDEIWAWAQGGKPGANPPEEIQGWDMYGETEKLSKGVDDILMDDKQDDGGVLLETRAHEKPKEDIHNRYVDGEDASLHDEVAREENEMTTKEIDEAFWNAFLYGVHQQRSNHKGDLHYGLNFPIPQSLIISNLVLPYLPAWTSAQAASLHIKKTSWKNAKKFIKALDKQKIVRSKDRDGGETVVLDIDFADPSIETFVPYKLPKKTGTETSAVGGGAPIATASSSGDDSIGQRLSKLILFRPKEQLSQVIEASNASVRQLYLSTELRSIITSYIESEDLISTTKKNLVKLNPVLANAVFDGQSSIDDEVVAKGVVPRDALMDRILESCLPFWAILRNEETREMVKAKAGHAPKIQLTFETRSGNKTVTKISGVELFHINPQPLADELQKACASSTSVNHLAGSSPKNPVQEIMVQGPQKDAVFKALEKRGVHKQWIEVLNKTKGRNKN